MQAQRILPVLLLLACREDASAAGGVTDLRSKSPPKITLPKAGGKYLDPVFGTTIIRVTDDRDGVRCVHAYAYWPAFNADGTRLLIACDDVARLYRFDRASDTLTRDGTLTGADGPPVQFEGASWSHDYPGTLYALDQRGTRLWRIDVSNRGKAGYTLLKDFSSWTGGLPIYQLSVSRGGGIFSFHSRDASGNHEDAFAWVRSTNATYRFPRPSGAVVDETRVDKRGSKVMINWSDGGMTLWDFRNGTSSWFSPDSESDSVSGHFDLGEDFIANSDGWNTGLVVRTWSATRSPDNILQYRKASGSLNWSICDHVSLREDDEVWVVASTYCGDGSWSPFEDEVYMARTDGSGFVRLAHTRSAGANTTSALRYWSQPRAVVDRTGHYIVYTSDLGSSTRFDVMLLEVPSAYWP